MVSEQIDILKKETIACWSVPKQNSQNILKECNLAGLLGCPRAKKKHEENNLFTAHKKEDSFY